MWHQIKIGNIEIKQICLTKDLELTIQQILTFNFWAWIQSSTTREMSWSIENVDNVPAHKSQIIPKYCLYICSLISSFSNFLTSSRLVRFFRLTAPAAVLGHLGAISLKNLTKRKEVRKLEKELIRPYILKKPSLILSFKSKLWLYPNLHYFRLLDHCSTSILWGSQQW